MNLIFTPKRRHVIGMVLTYFRRYFLVLIVPICTQKVIAQAGTENSGKEIKKQLPVSEATKNMSSVGDYVWIDANKNGLQDVGEKGIANIMVILYDSLLNTLDTKYTDKNGHYSFDNIKLPASGRNTFVVGFYNIPPDYAFTKRSKENEPNPLTSKADIILGRTQPFVLTSGGKRTDIDGGIVPSPGVVMPLIIDQLSGNYTDGIIQLGWNTFTEINTDHFNIERSTDGNNFRKIGRVDAKGGEVSSSLTYTYMDISAERGSNYYRLAMVDKNGNYNYSKSIMVVVDVKGISVMIVYPNPFSKRVQIKVNCDKAENIAVNIISNSGALMQTQQAQVQAGDNNIVIQNVDHLPPGIYIIEVASSTRKLRTKVMKLD